VVNVRLPPVPPPWPPMSERQIKRFLFRQGLLERRGLSTEAAERWADHLNFRDHDGDDRRLCLECRHYRAGDFTCREGGVVVLNLLQRCEIFDWEMPA